MEEGGFKGFESALVGIKPDGLEENAQMNIYSRVIGDNADLEIAEHAIRQLDPKTAGTLYQHIMRYPFGKPYVAYMTAQALPFYVLRGYDVIARIRGILGNTYPEKAEKGTLRAEFGKKERSPEGMVYNVAHCSDSVAAGISEPTLVFNLTGEELGTWFAEDIMNTFMLPFREILPIGHDLLRLIEADTSEGPVPSIDELMKQIVDTTSIEKDPDAQQWVRDKLEATVEAALL